MKTVWLGILCGVCLGTLASAQTDDTPLDRLERPDERSGWEAVGRVDVGDGFCTGVLIEPDLVLTAAHCLVDKRRGTPIDPQGIIFRAGYSDGASVATRRAHQTVVHPEYTDKSSRNHDSPATDIGLIRLDSAISTVLADPFHVGTQTVGNKVSVVSYARGREEALSWQRSCSVRKKWETSGVAAFSCDVTFGASGAPVFDTSGRRPEIVSVISRGGPTEDGIISYGPIIQAPIVELKEALRVSKGVNVAGGGVASRIRTSAGARFVKPGSGSRFVKP